MLEPISTPIKTEGGVQLDGAQARYPIPMQLTTAETVTITLSDFQSAFPHEKYRLLYDPSEWVRLVDSKAVPHEERIEPYPKDGWVFKPTTAGDATITFVIHQAAPCEQCSFEDRAVLEVKYYNFLIEPAP